MFSYGNLQNIKFATTVSKGLLYSNAVKSKALNAFEIYATLLEKRPIVTKIVTAGFLGAVGDTGCQLYASYCKHNISINYTNDEKSYKNQSSQSISNTYDFGRTAKYSFLTGVLIAPAVHCWYNILGNLFPGRSFFVAWKRMIIDQFFFAPVLTASFFSALLILEGKTDKIMWKLQHDVFPTLKAGWILWIPAQLINFRLIPIKYQVLFANVVGLVWNFYLSSQCFKYPSEQECISNTKSI